MEEEKKVMTLEEVNKEIARVKAEIEDAHGTTTEVYARIVGYYRAIRNWNKGKADEEKQRKMFNVEQTIDTAKARGAWQDLTEVVSKGDKEDNAEERSGKVTLEPCGCCKIEMPIKPSLQEVGKSLQEYFYAEVYIVGSFGTDLFREMQETPIKTKLMNIATKDNQEAMFAKGIKQVPCVAFFYDDELLNIVSSVKEIKEMFANVGKGAE